jgi:YVTN family beta-propeller protein
VATISNVEVPAVWNLDWDFPYNCGPLYNASYTDPGSQQVWFRYQLNDFNVQPAPSNATPGYICAVSPKVISPASTNFAIIGSFPGTITVGGSAPFLTEFGMPLLYVYDKHGNLVATETATSVSGDGTAATFPFPSNLTQSGYELIPQNQINQSPGLAPAGLNLLSIASSQTIAGNPFGVSIGGQTDVIVTCTYVPTPPHGGYTECPSTSTYAPVPVVSLYSAGQVLINGTAVNVGPNPTAVATYTANPVTTTNGNVTATIAGATQGMVANSGSNTVSILNLVNPSVIANVTVGNQPVALVTASNGSTAYVANYTDNTVTQVNLSTNTATATVPVGGHPTSVALSAGGTLWVGGAGFLTQINTSNMSVVGTESASGKTIVSLGYTDAYNELVVSSVDSGGNVYAEEVTAGSFVAGGAYTTAASQAVSTVATYLNPNTNTNVKGFTATLAKAGPIRINPFQPGAPPLVVQDGWAVITATPTGFTITDVSGNIVLVSQTTPSPVTAIAVDPNLHIAYLAEPDSNTLLTVPLPGIN